MWAKTKTFFATSAWYVLPGEEDQSKKTALEHITLLCHHFLFLELICSPKWDPYQYKYANLEMWYPENK